MGDQGEDFRSLWGSGTGLWFSVTAVCFWRNVVDQGNAFRFLWVVRDRLLAFREGSGRGFWFSARVRGVLLALCGASEKCFSLFAGDQREASRSLGGLARGFWFSVSVGGVVLALCGGSGRCFVCSLRASDQGEASRSQ